jgi:hypothetical protein
MPLLLPLPFLLSLPFLLVIPEGDLLWSLPLLVLRRHSERSEEPLYLSSPGERSDPHTK